MNELNVRRHPDPHVRHAVGVLAMVGELHKRGYEKIRVMPFMSPSGMHWRCWIGPAMPLLSQSRRPLV
jgi:hypothetical protein